MNSHPQNTEQVRCQLAEGTDFLLGNRFLKQQGQATAGRQDLLFTLHVGQTLVGATWLRKLDKDYWLRSLFVSIDHRHQGLASQLLQTVRHHIKTLEQAHILCLAKPELTDFYLKNDFRPLAFQALNAEWQAQFSPYLQQHPTWQIFIR
ncbi:MAG: GNAT family N-acetyltransferase [Thiotrichales bacterium]|nr:GNAT family N-acetyltransferase [Thiotrichales bacterium]